jgi:hypothetical protein
MQAALMRLCLLSCPIRPVSRPPNTFWTCQLAFLAFQGWLSLTSHPEGCDSRGDWGLSCVSGLQLCPCRQHLRGGKAWLVLTHWIWDSCMLVVMISCCPGPVLVDEQ